MKKLVLALIVICICTAGVLLGYQKFGILINVSESLPEKLFWLEKGKQPSRNDYVVFKNPINMGRSPDTMIKIIGGLSGDEVIHKQKEVWVKQKYIGRIKQFGQKGESLKPGPKGIIPKKHYFVYGLHQDSLDSRYQRIGWIHENDVVGIAHPIW